MATFLQAVQDLVSEVGIAGATGPLNLEIGRSTPGINRAIMYVRVAHAYICNLWPDWDFLHAIHEGQTTQQQIDSGSSLIPAPTPEPREYDTTDGAFQIRTQDGSWRNIRYMPWYEFRSTYRVGSARKPSDSPAVWTFRPDRTIELSSPIGGIFDYRFEYWFRAPELVNDDDPILIPDPRIVVVRAKMIFAERENAPEIMHGSANEYSELIEHLESSYAPGFRGGRTAETHLLVARDD